MQVKTKTQLARSNGRVWANQRIKLKKYQSHQSAQRQAQRAQHFDALKLGKDTELLKTRRRSYRSEGKNIETEWP